MMKKYIRPDMNIEEFMTEDILMGTSGIATPTPTTTPTNTGTASGFGDGGGDTPKMPWD